MVRTLKPHLIGRTILHAEFHSKFVTPGDRDLIAQQLAGRTVKKIERHGKFIVIGLDRGVLVVHLGMTGKLLLDGARGKHAYGIFDLDRGTLVFDDPRQFGRIEYSDALPARVARLGPEPLLVSLEEFARRLKLHKTPVKSLLLNQRFLRGVGNIYADEALFRSGIHPLTVARRIGRERAARLHQAIVEILTLAIEHRGSSVSDYVDADGERGNFQVLHQVYGRGGEECRVCGSIIKRIEVGQRGTHYCARCQRV